MLPVFPPLAILTSYFIKKALDNTIKLIIAMGAYSIVCIAAIIFYVLNKYRIPEADLSLYLPYIHLMIGAFSISSFVPLLTVILRGNKAGLLSLILVTVIQLGILVCATKNGHPSSVKNSYLYIKNHMPKNTVIYSYHHFHHDLPVYAKQPIPIINYEGELMFGKKQEPNSKIFVTESSFWQKWYENGSAPICVFAYKETGKNSFLSNLKSFGDRHTNKQKTIIPFEKRLAQNIPLLCNAEPINNKKPKIIIP
jgi:hypothetical protein